MPANVSASGDGVVMGVCPKPVPSATCLEWALGHVVVAFAKEGCIVRTRSDKGSEWRLLSITPSIVSRTADTRTLVKTLYLPYGMVHRATALSVTIPAVRHSVSVDGTRLSARSVQVLLERSGRDGWSR